MELVPIRASTPINPEAADFQPPHFEMPAAVENPEADGDGMENPMQTDSQQVHPNPVVAGTDHQCDAGYPAIPNSVLPISNSAVVSVSNLVFLKGDRDKLKAHPKYLVVGIHEGLSCELQKFTCSQFRSKVYLVPMSECYPVALTVLAQSMQGPICGLHKPSPFDSDDDADPVILPSRHSTVPALPLVVNQPPAYEPLTVPQPVHNVLPFQELPPVPAATVPSPCTPVSSPDCSVLSGAPPESAAVVPPRRSGRQ